jgi:hypothetical protein
MIYEEDDLAKQNKRDRSVPFKSCYPIKKLVMLEELEEPNLPSNQL